MEFVTGVEIKLSNNHPTVDICNDLAGKYPKDFMWTGWHPNCRCYQIPLLASRDAVDKMVDRILDGGEASEVAVEKTEIPGQFTDWMAVNRDRMERAKSLPYFIADNRKYFSGVRITGSAAKEVEAVQAFNEKLE